jgi:hypothetical protein
MKTRFQSGSGRMVDNPGLTKKGCDLRLIIN